MTTADTAIELTALQWNVMVGGIDGDNEGRRVSQVAFLESHPQLDLLWIMEGTGWHEGCRIHEVEDATDLTALPRVTSRIGDQVNHSIMFYNAEKLTPLGKPGELARGAFHHGTVRAAFDVDGTPLLALGTHLAYANPEARLAESHYLADYGGPFPGWPQDKVLLMDANAPDDNDPELRDWSRVPRYLWHRYRKRLPDGSWGGWDRDARRLLLDSGWRDPQNYVREQREATVGYWYDNEKVPLRLDQILVTGPRIEVVDYRTLKPETPDLTKLADHLPVRLGIRLHRDPHPPQRSGLA
jgi:endonuclease/exonuclease/phosphatase family metal-dependent hydrolase